MTGTRPTHGVRPRDVVLLPETGPAHDPKRPHANVVLGVFGTDVVLVPICKMVDDSDPACMLAVGELDAKIVSHPSCLEYRLARQRVASILSTMIAEHPDRLLGRIPGPTFERMVAGMKTSRRARDWTQRLFFPRAPRRVLRSDG